MVSLPFRHIARCASRARDATGGGLQMRRICLVSSHTARGQVPWGDEHRGDRQDVHVHEHMVCGGRKIDLCVFRMCIDRVYVIAPGCGVDLS